MDLVNALIKKPASSLLLAAGLCFGSQTASAEWPEFVSTGYFQNDESQTTEDQFVVRGQSSPYYSDPTGGTPAPSVVDGQQFAQGPMVGTSDPFVSGQFGAPPAAFDPFSPQGVYGINGPQPYRFGWKEQIDWAITPKASTSPNVGDIGWNELNYIKEWNGQGMNGGVWTFSPQLNFRWLEGPTTGPPGIESDLYRLGLGMKYATPQTPNGASFEFGFTPAIATDFGQSLTNEAWQFDAHVASFWRTSPTWMWVLGVLYWDRKDDIILPYAGAVWTPNDYFEARLLFPKARLEWFMGTPYGVPTWMYFTGEYHVEAYEIGLQAPFVGPPNESVLQSEDWRIMGGMRWESGWLETFIEAGLLFDRKIDFGVAGLNGKIDDAFMARVGFKF